MQIKTYKDVFFWTLCLIWLCSNFTVAIIFGNPLWSNIGFIIFMSVITFIKLTSNRFNDWLETPLNKYKQDGDKTSEN